MNLLAYHVLHEGHRMGPYDRRTIIGLRIKKTLAGEQQLEASDGSRLTVADLIGQRASNASGFNPMRSGSPTSARMTCSGSLIDSEPGPVAIPAFRGAIELRVHADVLRIAGRHRRGLRTRDGRIKLPLKDITHFRAAGPRLDLWLRGGDGPMAPTALQRLSFDLFSDSCVLELLQGLSHAQPWPEPLAATAPVSRPATNVSISPLLWASVIGIAMVAGFLLLVVVLRRPF